jgi:hypothetical protein
MYIFVSLQFDRLEYHLTGRNESQGSSPGGPIQTNIFLIVYTKSCGKDSCQGLACLLELTKDGPFDQYNPDLRLQRYHCQNHFRCPLCDGSEHYPCPPQVDTLDPGFSGKDYHYEVIK